MAAPKQFHIGHNHIQMKWTRNAPPVLTVRPGQDVNFDLMDCTGGQLNSKSTTTDMKNMKIDSLDPIFGPVYIEGAMPGDVLEIDFISLRPSSWAFTGVMPGFGLLEDEFPEAALKHFHIAPDDKYLSFKEGIKIPIRPFLGVCGVAPGLDGEFSTIPPLDTGGNIDCRHLTTGAKLYLPVQVPGGLFSCGDGHLAQGDGEVCGTAAETAMQATLRFAVHKDKSYITSPHYDTSGAVNRHSAPIDTGSYAVLGIHADLREACRRAVRAMIGTLMAEKGLTRTEAYMLASLAADLKIVEAVDMPNYAVALSLPHNIFT
jgi:acetamidase/formamidase